MLFCIDIGNTNIVLGICDGHQILNHWRIRTERNMTADEFGILIGNLFSASKIRMGDIKNIIVLPCSTPWKNSAVTTFMRTP
jgi:type III pantothenate kinase